jgi:predicted MFS family arabinose efflux permease
MPRWPLFRNRDYMLFWSGQALSELGSQTSTVAYPLLVLTLTGSAAKAGIVGLAKWLPLAIFAIPAGALADRVDRKRLMIASDAVRMLGAASIVAALWLGRPPFGQVAAVAFVDGGLFVTSYICERGALLQLVETRQVQDAVAQNEARYFGASIIGPPLGGLLFSIARALPFVTDTVSFVSSMATTALTRPPLQAATERVSSVRAGLTGGFAWLRRQPFYLTASLLFAAGNPVYTGLYLLAILLARRHGASSAGVGAMFAIVGAGGVLGALAAAPARRRLSPRAVVVGGEWVLLICVLTLLIARSAAVIGLLVATAEFVTPIGNSVVAGSRVAATPDHLQGRVAAVSATIAMSLGWVGPLAVGFAFQHAGASTTIVAVALWSMVLAAAATLAPALRSGPPGPVAAGGDHDQPERDSPAPAGEATSSAG